MRAKSLVLLMLFFVIPAARAELPRWQAEMGNDTIGRQWQLIAGEAVFDGECVRLRGGSTLVWKDFALSDFVLELEFRCNRAGSAIPALFVRGELESETRQWSAARVTWQAPVARRPGRWGRSRRAWNSPGSTGWQSLRVECVGDRIQVRSRGQEWTYRCAERSRGLFALAAMGSCNDSVTYRNVVITELNHQSLFNGRDLDGWSGAGADAADCWEVRDGRLRCTGEKGPWLRTRETYGDFNLRMEYKLGDGGNSGVYVRVPEDGRHHGAGAGIEVQILDDYATRYQGLKPYQCAGGLYAIVAPERGHARVHGYWNALEINCRGTHYRVQLNGTVVIDTCGDEYPELNERRLEGFLGLQNHSEPVWFRNIRIGPAQ